jgi:hypothetical protein
MSIFKIKIHCNICKLNNFCSLFLTFVSFSLSSFLSHSHSHSLCHQEISFFNAIESLLCCSRYEQSYHFLHSTQIHHNKTKLKYFHHVLELLSSLVHSVIEYSLITRNKPSPSNKVCIFNTLTQKKNSTSESQIRIVESELPPQSSFWFTLTIELIFEPSTRSIISCVLNKNTLNHNHNHILHPIWHWQKTHNFNNS